MESAPASRKTVLLVDDNEGILTTTAIYLRGRGLSVVTAAGAFGVSALVAQHCPDVLVLDLMMPAMKGDGLLEVIRRQPSASKLPTIFYSSAEEEVLYRLARGVPGASYVQKSDGLPALYAAIRATLSPPPPAS